MHKIPFCPTNLFPLLLGSKWAAQKRRKCGIVYKYKNPERRKCRVWLKCYLNVTSMYMEHWNLLPKMTTVPLQATEFFRDVHRQPRTSRILLVREPLCFLKWRNLKWGSWGKTGFWIMPVGLLQEPHCARPMVLKGIHVSDSQHF